VIKPGTLLKLVGQVANGEADVDCDALAAP